MTRAMPEDSGRLDRFRTAARILEAEAVTYLWPFGQRQELCLGEQGPCLHEDYQEAWNAFEQRMEERADRAASDATTVGVSLSHHLAFVNSSNQLAALSPTIRALRRNSGCDLVAEGDAVAHAQKHGAEDIFGYRCRGASHAIDFARTHAALLREVCDRTASAKPSALFDIVYSIFGAIALMDARSPRVVLLSNDHLMSHRTLISAARLMGAQIAYVQHAAVSPLFPRLDVDIAFLDGVSAAETYMRCAENGPGFKLTPTEPLVLLTGQKKHVLPRDPGGSAIGIACNLLDDIDTMIGIARGLAAAGHIVCLRWHPRQEAEQIRQIVTAAESAPESMGYSDSASEPVNEFLRGVHTVVAGDSSILLESAIAGCRPIYLRSSDRVVEDYYGFVANGLARRADNLEGIVEALSCDGPSAEAIRHFSATYGTAWQGFEGELAAGTLERLAAGATILDLFVPREGPFPNTLTPRTATVSTDQARRRNAMS